MCINLLILTAGVEICSGVDPERLVRMDPQCLNLPRGGCVHTHLKAIRIRESDVTKAILRVSKVCQQVAINFSTGDGVVGKDNSTRSEMRLNDL